MKREEAMRRGYEIFPVKPSMKRRAAWHNYRHPGYYMLTLVVAGRRSLFGRLELDPEPHIVLTAFGRAIAEVEVAKIGQFYPNVRVVSLCMMPDHLHLIVHVDGWLKPGQHLGDVVRGLKVGCNCAWRAANGGSGNWPQQGLFEIGYNDRLLFSEEQLERWVHYLNDNPRRLAIKRLNPNLFTVKRNIPIAGYECQIVGNQFLLDIPDKVAVIIHRRYTDDETRRLTNQWLACGERGGVLVSAAISPKERAVLTEARSRGYRVIWLRENGFPKLYKPAGRDFDACSRGQILQISPWEYHNRQQTITRQQCLELNALVMKIAQGTG